jgi:putative oxidoreductase
MTFLRKYQDPLYTLLRVVAGVFYACHGAQKLFGLFGGPQLKQPLMVTAGVIELGGGLLIAIGLLTGIAAFIASGEMAAAYFMVHFPTGWLPIQNHGELAAIYCFLFLFIAARGGGPHSVDARRR